MNTEINRESAKILMFPKGGRAAVIRAGDKKNSVQQTAIDSVASAAFGGAWYHEAAMQETERSVKR